MSSSRHKEKKRKLNTSGCLPILGPCTPEGCQRYLRQYYLKKSGGKHTCVRCWSYFQRLNSAAQSDC
jgi:5,10-methylene-tetrahydrofolate dehydrogenase/methenyl tetrahydrofolate cyclohydrolase